MADEPEFVYLPVHVSELVPRGEDLVQEVHTPVCDFCFDMRCRWSYDCEEFEIREIHFASTEGWLSCERCSELIEAGDVAGLAQRSVKSWTKRMGKADLWHVGMIQTIQQGFWDHRLGSREAYG